MHRLTGMWFARSAAGYTRTGNYESILEGRKLLLTDPIPVELLREYSREFPQAWRQIAKFREARGRDLTWWPDWCYCPIAGSLAIITEGAWPLDNSLLSKMAVHPPAVMSALAAWRITKGIYRFDETLLSELAVMPLEGDLPSDIFYSLPEWCVFIETPGMKYTGGEIAGLFASLEYDINDNRHELRLVMVNDTLECIPVAVHLGKWSVREAIERFYSESKRVLQERGLHVPGLDAETENISNAIPLLTPFISLVLYICSVNADYGAAGRPRHPSRQPIRKGKIQVANEPRTWDIGVRIGPALRRAAATSERETGDRTHASPRPHYRRAHWHHYWTGPRNEPDRRKMILKWLPPIPVGISDLDGEEETPAVVRRINKEEE